MARYTDAQRKAMAESDFAGPDHSFPVMDQQDVDAAKHLIGHAADPEAVKKRIIEICKAKNLTCPASWQAEKMSDERGFVSREADLFEAGEYPDRNLTVTEDDIARLAATSGAIPIHVEHAGGPVKLGEVGALRAAGKWLKGTLNLFPEANALLDRLGVNTLSVAVSRALDRVHEVSVTGTPRVAGARMFSGGDAELVVFSLGERPQGGSIMPDANGASAEQFSQLQAQFADLQTKLTEETAARVSAEAENAKTRQTASELTFALRSKDAAATVDPLVQKGIVKPAQRDAAVALLLSDSVVKFSDADKPVAEIFAGFLEQMTPVVGPSLRGEITDTATKEARVKFYVDKGLSPEGAEKAAEIEMAEKG